MGLHTLISLKEWDIKCKDGEAFEVDLKNGDIRFLPIECPNIFNNRKACKAKLVRGTRRTSTHESVHCGVCRWEGLRRLGK